MCSVTDKGIKALVEHCKSLKKVDISGTSVTKDSVEIIVKNCPILEVLFRFLLFKILKEFGLFALYFVTDQVVGIIAENSEHLKVIDLRYCRCSGVGINNLLNKCHKLKSIGVTGLGGTVLSILQEHRKAIQKF